VKFSATVQTGPGAYPATHTTGTESFPVVKWAGRGVDDPHPSNAEVKERVDLYLYSPSGPSWPVLGLTFLFYSTFTATPLMTTCHAPLHRTDGRIKADWQYSM
jgi:hypothetical protein